MFGKLGWDSVPWEQPLPLVAFGLAALGILAQVPTIVVCGDADRLTPLQNSVRMYSELGDDSDLVVVAKAGHMVQMEQPEIVSDAIDDVVSRSRVSRGHPRRWRKLMSRGSA